MSGRDDQMSQVSCMYALEKTIKIGIVSGSVNSNVGMRETPFLMVGTTAQEKKDKMVEEQGSAFLDIAAKVLEDPPGNSLDH